MDYTELYPHTMLMLGAHAVGYLLGVREPRAVVAEVAPAR